MPAPSPIARIISDATEAAIVGAGWREYKIDVEHGDSPAPIVRVRVRVPWWRGLWFDPLALETRVLRLLEMLATTDRRRLTYRVHVERLAA